MTFIETLRRDWLSNVRGDVLAGIVVALALIPKAIGFSIIAGVDPKVGLYASFSIAVIISITGGRPGMISAVTAATAEIMITLVREVPACRYHSGWRYSGALGTLPPRLRDTVCVAFGDDGLCQRTRHSDLHGATARADRDAVGNLRHDRQSVINVKSGGRGRLSTFVAGALLLFLILVLGNSVRIIPMPALVAIMIMVSIGTFSWSSIDDTFAPPPSVQHRHAGDGGSRRRNAQPRSRCGRQRPALRPFLRVDGVANFPRDLGAYKRWTRAPLPCGRTAIFRVGGRPHGSFRLHGSIATGAHRCQPVAYLRLDGGQCRQPYRSQISPRRYRRRSDRNE